ncbi:MAG: serine protease [Hyphomicrobium sp.]|nr:serine protease [Hyphomicrobium sp.]
MSAFEVDVYVGSHDFTGGERIGVANIIRHENYNADSQDSDIALLELATEPRNKSRLEKMRLVQPRHHASLQRGAQAIVVGWGSTERGKVPLELRSAVSRLQYFDSIQIKDVGACNRFHVLDARKEVAKVLQARGASASDIRSSLDKWYPPHAQMISQRMFCAGSHDGSGDACFGDSGGPLLVRTREGVVQVGIVSWGPSSGCGLTNAFGVYVRLSRFTDWIGSNTGLSGGR